MEWTYTGFSLFSKCQKKWYFKKKAAHWNVKDPFRKEAFYLSQLKSLETWRGQLVDTVISEKIINNLYHGKPFPSYESLMKYTDRVIEEQIEFARTKKYREEGIRKGDFKIEYNALYNFDYGLDIDDGPLLQAIEEIKLSIENLLSQKSFLKMLEDCDWIGSQRSLSYKLGNINIKGTPDVIGFRKDSPPIIVDWKVKRSGSKNYWLQLALYALVLANETTHRDWPLYLEEQEIDPTMIELYEFQLLQNSIRKHTVDEMDIDEIEILIQDSHEQMNLLVEQKIFSKLNFREFLTAKSVEMCEKCEFKKICWEKN